MAGQEGLATELAEFQLFLNQVMPYGARIVLMDERRGRVSYYTSQAVVLEARSYPGNVVYDVMFGAPGPAQANPGSALMATVTDPFEQIRPGVWRAEILQSDGTSQDEPQFVLIRTITDLSPEEWAQLQEAT